MDINNMKTMNNYSICCTEEQTKKALELGAPIRTEVKCLRGHFSNDYIFEDGNLFIYKPTAEQMIGWLEEQGILIDIDTEWNKSVSVYVWDCENKSLIYVFHGSREDATLAGIDAALEYLTNNKK